LTIFTEFDTNGQKCSYQQQQKSKFLFTCGEHEIEAHKRDNSYV